MSTVVYRWFISMSTIVYCWFISMSTMVYLWMFMDASGICLKKTLNYEHEGNINQQTWQVGALFGAVSPAIPDVYIFAGHSNYTSLERIATSAFSVYILRLKRNISQ